MKKQIIKNYQFYLGVFTFLTGIMLFAILSSPLRYFGVVFISFSILYFVIVFYSKISDSNDEKYKSRIRDQILKHQYKK